jgi:hypothetical protein
MACIAGKTSRQRGREFFAGSSRGVSQEGCDLAPQHFDVDGAGE